MVEAGSTPYGNIADAAALGRLVRARRKAQGATQAEFAALCGVGTRFVSDLENGKPTVELGKALLVLAGLGLDLRVEPRSWPPPRRVAEDEGA
ncbi:MAG: helix-turn-helix transcriptional regulator [Thiohalospira sp.]